MITIDPVRKWKEQKNLQKQKTRQNQNKGGTLFLPDAYLKAMFVC